MRHRLSAFRQFQVSLVLNTSRETDTSDKAKRDSEFGSHLDGDFQERRRLGTNGSQRSKW